MKSDGDPDDHVGNTRPAALSLEGLPPDAKERLSELSGDGGTPALFTSDLSVNEFMLIKEAGFHPRGLVFGSSIFNVGISKRSWWRNQEGAPR